MSLRITYLDGRRELLSCDLKHAAVIAGAADRLGYIVEVL